jgi:Mg2+ and Co2+ transporter CorA
VTVIAAVAGIFGMNLSNPWGTDVVGESKSLVWFFLVTGGSFLLAVVMFLAAIA